MKKQYSMMEGNITKGILVFAIPIFFSNLFQQLYNTIDVAIVAHYLGDEALATMGSTTAIYDLMIGFSQGIGMGFTIICARYFGSKEENKLKNSVATGLILALISAIIITIIFYFGMPTLLELLKTPSEIMVEALKYIQVIALFLTVTIFYNYSAGLLRAIGNSMISLLVLAVASILNIILDIVFITVFQLGVSGAAIATVIAQSIATIICTIAIFRKEKILIPKKEHFIFDKHVVLDMCGQGYSMGLMFSIVSIGTLTLQSAINTLGTTIITAHTTARKLLSLINLPLSTLCASMSTFVSQNKGANQYDRIRKGVKIANTMGIIYAICISIVIYFFADVFVVLLSNSENILVIENSSMYLRINIPFLCVLTVLLNLRNALQGLGKKVVPLFSSIIELIGKFIFTYIIIEPLQYYGVCICEPIIWICMMMQLLYSFYGDENIKNAKPMKT